MKIAKTAVIFLMIFSLTSVFQLSSLSEVGAQSPEDQRLDDINQQIEQYQNEIERLGKQAATLSNQIARFNTQIILRNLEIAKIEEQILILTGRIVQLTDSLDSLYEAFSNRAVETYKMARVGDSFMLLISAPDLSKAISRFHYLKRIQEEDRKLFNRLEEAQDDYEEEKGEQEELQFELEVQKQELDRQKAAKAHILQVTRSDERRYQQLLAQVRAEFEAIQAIIAGRGDESQVGQVNEGQRIASIIQGASCSSSGSHIHFIVSQGGNANNPFSYLRSDIDYENCSGSSCGSGDSDSFNPSGSWIWPINPKIELTQGYGPTWAVRNTWVGRIYSSHNGIDINSASSEVKAVKSGTMYRGSYVVGGGCTLRYVRVDHDGSDLETFYLHINY